MLVLIKLVLPTSLSLPMSLGYWFGDKLGFVEVDQTSEAEQTIRIPQPSWVPARGQAAPFEPVSAGPTEPAPVPRPEHVPAEPVNPPTVSLTPLSWQGAVFLAWLAVVSAMALLLLQRAIFVRGLVARAKAADSSMKDILASCCERMAVKRKVGLKVSPNASSPAVCGLFHPVILVPENLAPSLGSKRLRAVLTHELAHIKRGDLWVNLAQTFLQVVYFYNPLLWLANAIIRRVREQAVDEAVLVAMGQAAQQYPQTLVEVAKLTFDQPALSLRLIGVVESQDALAGRIKHILNRPIPKTAKLGLLGLLTIIIAALVLLPMAAAEDRGQKTDDRVEKQFTAILPNGATVELIGMCEYPSADKQWWQPDGSLLVNPPYDESNINILSFVEPNTIPIEFAFRLSGNLGEPAWEARVKGDEQAFVWWTGRRAKDGEFLTDIKSIGMFVKSDQRTLDLRLGFSFADRPYEWVDFKNISVKPNSKPDVQVEGEEVWGEAVEGVQCRLRAEKIIWQSGEWSKFRADLRNHGQRRLSLGLAPENWKIELNGLWYRPTVSFRSLVRKLSLLPGQHHNDVLLLLEEQYNWRSKEGERPLEFRPGRHTVRFALQLSSADEGRSLLSVVSNPVEIEILPAEAKNDVQVEVTGQPSSTVRGKVLDSQGQPVKGATVELQIFVGGDVDDTANYRAQRVFTDANGLYTFEGLETGSAHIGRAFIAEDGSTSGVPYGLMFDFEIEAGKSYDITLGGKGRPVVGRFVPASGNAGDIDWSKARAYFDLRAAPMTMGFMQDNLKILRAMIKSQGGDFYRKSPVAINPDGTFRIDDVRAGHYMLRVKVIEEPKKEGLNLFRDVRIPLMRDGTTETPLNLGSLVVSHGDHKAPRRIDNHFLDLLEFDKDIPVILKAGNDEEPDVVTAKSIRFSKDGESVTAALDVEWKSLVDERWRVRLRLLSENGSYLAWHDVFFETFKIIGKYPQSFEEQLNFSLGRWPDLSKIKHFSVTIQPISNELIGNVRPGITTAGPKSKLVWGEAVNGLRAAVEFVPEKESYSLGERVGVRFHIQNVSDRNIQITSTSWRQEKGIFVQDDEGKKISLTTRGGFSGLPRIVRHILTPSETVVLESSGLGFGDAASKKDINTKPLTSNFIRCGPGRYILSTINLLSLI